MRILVIDDDQISLALIRTTLQKAGYEVATACDGVQAWEMMRGGDFRLILSDWEMPGIDGVELCRRLRSRQFGRYVYVILVTVRGGPSSVVKGLQAGADDFVTKPFDPTELCVRVRAGQRMLSLDSRNLMIFTLAKLADSRDPETGAHLERMREYCRILAQRLATFPKYEAVVDGEYVQALYLTSPLHDIGKVGIPDSVLLKPGELTEREFEIMQMHTVIGAETLDVAATENPDEKLFSMARDIALTHHERFDGSGYPHGTAGDQIPLAGRIVAIADMYDALTSKRVYKPAFSHDVARSFIVEGRGRQLDPDLVDCFLEVEDEFDAIRRQLNDERVAQKHAPMAAHRELRQTETVAS